MDSPRSRRSALRFAVSVSGAVLLLGLAACVPNPNGAALQVASISAGTGHTCAVQPDRSVVCWGLDYSGGTTTQSNVPLLVPGVSDVIDVSAGSEHSCALRANHTVPCWGENVHGQLGDGSVDDAIALSARGVNTCVVRSDHTVACWGSNLYGQLGNGSSGDQAVSTPQTVVGLSDATAVAVGGTGHACALKSDQTVACWGWNMFGQLGNGNNTDASTPQAVTGLTGVTAISAGPEHTCALKSDDTVRCWGYNSGYGELGTGNYVDANTPQGVVGLTDAVAISAGGHFTCAIRSGGTAACWGENGAGQLGNGTQTRTTVPGPVSGLSGVASISGGGDHTCATLRDGTAACWGGNRYGQVGNGTFSTLIPPYGYTTPQFVIAP